MISNDILYSDKKYNSYRLYNSKIVRVLKAMNYLKLKIQDTNCILIL